MGLGAPHNAGWPLGPSPALNTPVSGGVAGFLRTSCLGITAIRRGEKNANIDKYLSTFAARI